MPRSPRSRQHEQDAFSALSDGGRQMAASIVAENGDILAFMDLRQAKPRRAVPGQVLVLPRRHVPDLHTLTAEDMAAALRRMQRVALALREEFELVGLNLWQSSGCTEVQ